MDTPPLKLAALDIDGTLFPGALGLTLFEELVARGLCRSSYGETISEHLTHYRTGQISRADMSERAAAAYAAAIRGLLETDVEGIARDVWRREQSRMFRFARPLIAMLRASGFTPVLISASPSEIVACLGRGLGSLPYRGSRYGVSAGKYDGRVLEMPGMPGQKARLLHELVGGHGFDARGSLAIGNSIGDESMLVMVGHAIAFEPDRSLRDVARARGWTLADRDNILDCVRDVIAMMHR